MTVTTGNHSTWRRSAHSSEDAVVYAAARRALELGQQIHDARTARGWSQTRLAKESGVRQATVSSIEAADHTPNLDTLDRLARALDLDLVVTLTARPMADA